MPRPIWGALWRSALWMAGCDHLPLLLKQFTFGNFAEGSGNTFELPARCAPIAPARAAEGGSKTSVERTGRAGSASGLMTYYGPLMMVVLASLAFVLAANAVVAFAAISKLEEPRPR